MQNKDQIEKIEMEELNAFDRAAQLLDALCDGSVPEDIKERIREWLISESSQVAKDKALDDLFSSLIPNLTPDEYEYEQLSKITRKLGFSSPKKTRRVSLGKRILRIAAFVVPFMVLTGVLYLKWRNVEEYITIYAYNEEQTVCLPDETEVTLFPNSSITYKAKEPEFLAERSVGLEGCAFFKVTPADSVKGIGSFVVAANSMETTVLGTDFKMSEYEDSGKASLRLYDGRVNVGAGEDEFEIMTGEYLDYDRCTGEVLVGMIPVKEMIEAGYKPVLKFEGVTYDDIILAIGANFDVEFEYENELDLNSGNVFVDLEGKTLQRMMNILTMINNDFRFTFDDDRKITISKK